MFATLFAGPHKEPRVDMTATLKRPVRSDELISFGAGPLDVKGLLCDKEIAVLNKFVNELINFRYGWAPISELAVPTAERLLPLYARLEKVEFVREENKTEIRSLRWKPKMQAADWGGYTLDADTIRSSFQNVPSERISVVELESKYGKMFGKKLVYVAVECICKNSIAYSFSDIRHFLCLEKNPSKMPPVMRNGKANIFAGTTIMIASEPYVLVATWKCGGFEKELVPLSIKLEDTAQFVMVKK